MSQRSDRAEAMRVTMLSRRVHPAHGPGGLERHVFDLTTELGRLGVGIELYAERPPERARLEAAERAFSETVTPHWVPGGWLPLGRRPGTIVADRNTNYFLWSARVAARLLADTGRRPGLVHAHGLAGWGVARARVGGRLTAPLVSTMQGLEEFRSHHRLKHWAYGPFRRGIRTVARASSALVTTDVSLRPIVTRYLGVPPGEQIVIPNAIDPERCRAMGDVRRGVSLLADLGLERASPVFVSVGRLEANKGFTVLVDALASVEARLPAGWAWLLVGAGPERATVQRAIVRAGMAARCRLTGPLSERDLHSLLSVATWFVHPTRYEGSSLVTLEAMAHGLPVVASRTGGLPDKVEDGRTGFLVPPADAAALGEALVAATAADHRTLGAAGRRLCDSRFSWAAAARRYVELYERLLTPESA